MTTKIYTLRTNHELYKKLYDENVSLKLKNNMHNDNILMNDNHQLLSSEIDKLKKRE